MKPALARLNHILLPSQKAERDRARRSRLLRPFLPIIWLYRACSEEGRVVLVGSVLVGTLGLEVQATAVYLLWSILTALLFASLVLRPLYRFSKGATLTVAHPRRVFAGDEVRFVVRIDGEQGRSHDRVRVRGPMLPWDGAYVGRRPADKTLTQRSSASFMATAVFTDRGEHHLDPFMASSLTPLGLVQGPLLESEGCKLLVVPRVARLASLALPSARRHQPGGAALPSRTGESMELLGTRPYRPGDALRDLHARSSARAGVPIVREYQQEYFARFGVVLDTDASASTRVREAGICLAAGIVAHLSRGEALIDLLAIGDELHLLPLGRSIGFLEQALDRLAIVQPSAPLDPGKLPRKLSPYLAQLSSVIVISLGWTPPRQALVQQLSRHTSCRALVVVDDDQPHVAAVIGAEVVGASIIEQSALAHGSEGLRL